MSKAVVALSGGQDSVTCLFWALNQFGDGNVEAVAFNYGQRHSIELECAARIAEKAGVKLTTLSVPAFNELGAAALTNTDIAVNADATDTGNVHAENQNLPSTFVPARNLIFLGLLGAYAAQHEITNIVTGVCEADEAGYPDCRSLFIESFEETINLALGFESWTMIVHTPLITLNKAKTFELADRLGVLDVIVNDTHTCYEGVHDADHFHAWGYGCGECPACVERMNGFASMNDHANL